jgi:aspartyl-tRNA(Asn)/glutamyl-tRNA(Gln) amidotransferase subunit C
VTLTRRDVENDRASRPSRDHRGAAAVYVGSLSVDPRVRRAALGAATDDVVPMAHPLEGQVQRLREDSVTESDRRESYQRNAASVEAGLYLVPKVIE